MRKAREKAFLSLFPLFSVFVFFVSFLNLNLNLMYSDFLSTRKREHAEKQQFTIW